MILKPVYVGAALVLLLAGCGGSNGTDGTTSASGSGAGATTAAATAEPSATADAADGCDVSQAVKDQATDSHITKVQVIGGCSQVSLETTLTSGAGGTARKICDAVAKVAYVGNVSSVSVDGSDGHELAAGEKGMGSCIGQPG